MAGEDRAHVLDAEVALDERLAQVAERRGDGDGQTPSMTPSPSVVERADPGDRGEDRTDDDRDDHAADQPLDRLVRAGGGQRLAPGVAADEQAADVVGDGADDRGQQDRRCRRRPAGQHQRGERAEQPDPADAEQRDADVEHRAVAAGADEVPEQARPRW